MNAKPTLARPRIVTTVAAATLSTVIAFVQGTPPPRFACGKISPTDP